MWPSTVRKKQPRKQSYQSTKVVSCQNIENRSLVRSMLTRFSLFLGGSVASLILSVFLIPILEEIKLWSDQYLCPISPWCRTHLAFKAYDEAQCSIGSVGVLVAQAIGDGDLASGSRDDISISLRDRTYLCDDIVWPKRKAVEHLQDLDFKYSDCFVYHRVVDNNGPSNGVTSFKVKMGFNSKVCISNFWKNPNSGMLERTHNLNKAFAYCMPNLNLDVPMRQFSEHARLPVCDDQDLEAVGFPDRLLSQ